MTNSFIETQKELAREEMRGMYYDDSDEFPRMLDTLITQVIQNTLEEVLQSLKGTNFLEKIEDEQDNRNSGIEVYRRIRDHIQSLLAEMTHPPQERKCTCNISPDSIHYKDCPLVTPPQEQRENMNTPDIGCKTHGRNCDCLIGRVSLAPNPPNNLYNELKKEALELGEVSEIEMGTPDTEVESVEEVVEKSGHVEEACDFAPSARVMHLPYVKKLLQDDRTSRNTYWKEREALTSEREYLRGFREAQYLEKERVRKEVEGMKKEHIPADNIWEGDEEEEVGEWKLVPKEDGMYCLNCKRFTPEEGCICGLISFEALDKLLDNLK